MGWAGILRSLVKRSPGAAELAFSLSNPSRSRPTTKPRGALPPRLTPDSSDLLRKWRPVVIGPGALHPVLCRGQRLFPQATVPSTAGPAIGTIATIAAARAIATASVVTATASVAAIATAPPVGAIANAPTVIVLARISRVIRCAIAPIAPASLD